jgi:mobilization protein NikA
MGNSLSIPASDDEAQGGRRPRQGARRPHRVEFTLTDEELALLEGAARRSGRSRGAYAAEAALAAAQRGPATGNTVLAEALGELVRASGLVRRIGVNLNQAVARLNATGQRSGDLLPYARESLRRAEMLTSAAEDVRKAIR